MATFTGSLKDTKVFWFASQGYTSTQTLNDNIRAYLLTKVTTSSSNQSLSDLWRAYMKNLGRVEGTFNDMYRQTLLTSLAISGNPPLTIGDLELRFYGDSTHIFS